MLAELGVSLVRGRDRAHLLGALIANVSLLGYRAGCREAELRFRGGNKMANEIPGREWFQGTIGKTLDESEPHFRPEPHPGDGAPNVLVILYDDLGFSHLNCFGSTLHTPTPTGWPPAGTVHELPRDAGVLPTRASLLRAEPPHRGHAVGVEHAVGVPLAHR